MELLIKNGRVVDGTGVRPYVADILIDHGKIVDIGRWEETVARRTIDARGKIVSPGFIDCHTHSEISLMHNRQHPNAVYQGIATVVTGMCGLGFAPVKKENFENAIKVNAGIFSDVSGQLPRWERFEDYLALLDGCAVNVASNVTHNAVRQMATDFTSQPLKGKALDVAKEQLGRAFEEGAVGFSVGLSYYPGTYSDTEELIELCKVVKQFDGVFCVHLRLNTIGPEFDPIQEMVRVASATGVRMHMLHHRTKYPSTMGHIEKILEPFDECKRYGSQVTFEYYPYLTGSGYMVVLLPGWIQDGGYPSIMERLTDPKQRDRIRKDIEQRYPLIVGSGTTGVITHLKDPYSEYLGRTFEEVAAMQQKSIPEMIIDLLADNELEVGFHGTEPQDKAIQHQLFEDQYHMFQKDNYTIGSDTIPTGEWCHPRTFGTYPRIIRQALAHGMPIEEIVKKITYLPAQIYGLEGRGILKKGYQADVVIFDHERIKDWATYEMPRKRPQGVDTLIVNGKIVMEDTGISGLLPGRAIKKGR